MNTITILIPERKPLNVDYKTMAEVQLAVLQAGLGNISDPKVKALNAGVVIETPSGTPKNRISELGTIVSSFGLKEVVTNEDSEWEKAGFGSKVDWSQDEPLKHRGVNLDSPEDCEAVREVIGMFQKATVAWKELKDDGIVQCDGNFHIKTLPEFMKKRGSK